MSGFVPRRLNATDPKTWFLATALLGGLWWLPIRWLEASGFDGAWAGIALTSGAIPAVAIISASRPLRWLSRRHLLGATAIGVAISLYSIALTGSDVIRVLVLFYLAPVWSLMIERLFLMRPLRIHDLAFVILALAGIAVMSGSPIDLLRLSVSAADVMALISGILFSLGSAAAFRETNFETAHFTLVVLVTASLFGAIMALVSAPGPVSLAQTFDAEASLSLMLVLGCLYCAPILFMTCRAAKLLPPSKLTLLFAAEVLSGAASAAVLLGERLSSSEIMGSGLIAIAIIGAMRSKAESTLQARSNRGGP